ncbi:RNA 2',3'-cyclic phosphodiesterase [Chromobacterium vaccinii]|uniref:RNA 2',3'-cyclic phosphodiesterase n=2 Tax=Chromobacterium vaccinii TaxID=1108595 RepID=UPI001E39B6AB|nr:RNA 2',3'-cyclic phosphodiesterase [Chromobacterium vaccinii]MCD4486067.1 RNA 2',3'-cyclic phosphodiesterase [Chromobacterium vaccinii]MCD4498392.1 RNA 2',3'-cyclic phosphodiesterase [Chromobacterium vaccinii]
MRAFLACLPPPECLAGLQAWQKRLRRQAGGRALAAAQLHLTLVFLGELTPLRLQQAADCAERAAANLPPAIVLDGCGSWRDVGWCGPAHPPPALCAWVERLKTELRAAGLAIETQAYRPHLTLLRRLARPLPEQALPPLALPLAEVALLASELRADGARHYRLDGWRREPSSCR